LSYYARSTLSAREAGERAATLSCWAFGGGGKTDEDSVG